MSDSKLYLWYFVQVVTDGKLMYVGVPQSCEVPMNPDSYDGVCRTQLNDQIIFMFKTIDAAQAFALGVATVLENPCKNLQPFDINKMRDGRKLCKPFDIGLQ